MAKRISKRRRRAKKTAVKTVTKRIYVKAKKAARRAKRAASMPVSKKDIILSVAGAGAGSIGGAIVLQKLPDAIPDIAKSGGVAAIGGVLAYLGIKKKNKILMGAGLGMGAVGVRGLVASFVPTMAGYEEVPYMYNTTPQIANSMAAPFAAPFAGEYEPMSAPFDGDDTMI